MDHMCTALAGSECSVCEQRKQDQEQFVELAQLKALVTQLATSNDTLLCNLVEIAANLGVPNDQVGYDGTMLRIHAYKQLLEACRIYVSTGDADFIIRALIPFTNDPT